MPSQLLTKEAKTQWKDSPVDKWFWKTGLVAAEGIRFMYFPLYKKQFLDEIKTLTLTEPRSLQFG